MLSLRGGLGLASLVFAACLTGAMPSASALHVCYRVKSTTNRPAAAVVNAYTSLRVTVQSRLHRIPDDAGLPYFGAGA